MRSISGFTSSIVVAGLLLLAVGTTGPILAVETGEATPVGLSVGDPAPAFEAKDDTGRLWKSSAHVGNKVLVVYFYPAAMTGGCTKQACSYRDDREALMDLGAEVIGVSGDTVEGQAVFKKAHGLNFTLLADTEGEIARALGVPLRDGGTIKRTVEGEEISLTRGVTTSRWTFVIGLDGKIAYVNQKVKAAEDSKAVIDVIASLNKKGVEKAE